MIAEGTRVRVRNAWPERDGPCHIRTPHYVRGHVGRVVRGLGAYPNPEDLAFRRPAPRLPLYHVAFDPASLWPDAVYDGEIVIELYEPWLEPA